MALASGMRLGPYEVLSPLGAGGMGEVWRARDTRLGRDVAIKVLPDSVSNDAKALARFESEARAVAALSHPNILFILDVGEAGRVHYVVTELLEGETLRALVSRGPVPVKRALEIGHQVAEALAAAHAKGIVHRDVKPENVFLTGDGHVKVLDFGLARVGGLPVGRDETESPTVEKLTGEGAVVGTVAYMSPEQAGGRTVDFRSDQFSLGIVLYEMLTGSRPFRGATAAETLTAIIREEPEPLGTVAPKVPAPARWIVERLLSKESGERYDSTRDLARELSGCRVRLSDATSSPAAAASTSPGSRAPRRWGLAIAAALLSAAALFAAGALVTSRVSARAQPSIRRLTFQRGQVTTARFLPDGQSVVYAAAWGDEPLQIYTLRLDGPESRPLGLRQADLLAVSPTSEIALGLGAFDRMSFVGIGVGTLATVPFSGGSPRPVAESILTADFSPDGRSMAAVVGWDRLDHPLGTALFRDPGSWFGRIRLSPAGDRVALPLHPRQDVGGAVAVVAAGGKVTKLTGYLSVVEGLAWSPGGDEVWYSGTRQGSRCELMAVSLAGRERRVFAGLGSVLLHDIARDGRVLVSTLDIRRRFFFGGSDPHADRDLSWFDRSAGWAISDDEKLVLIEECGEAVGSGCSLFVRETDGSAPRKIGNLLISEFPNLSRDGRFVVVSRLRPPAIDLIPVAAGPTRTIALPGFDERALRQAGLMADGRTLWFVGEKAPGRARYWITDVNGTPPQPASPENVRPADPWITADERNFVGRIGGGDLPGERDLLLLPRDGGEPRPVPGVSDDDELAGTSPDGRFVYAFRKSLGFPVAVRRVELASGRSEVLREISPPDRAGGFLTAVRMTPDGRHVYYNLTQRLGDLHVIEGLR